MSIYLNLSVSSRVRELGQLQLSVSHHNVVALLQLANAPDKTTLSSKKGRWLDVTIQTPKGATITLRQGDTHAVWIQHNQGDAKAVLEWAYANGGARFLVTDVTYTDEGGSGGSTVVAQPMEDCPF